jgi:predicted HicB family RNase H-like nuclease
MTDTTRRTPGIRRPGESGIQEPGGESWEQRHVRVTFWLERNLREEVREAAKARALSLTQFIAQALRRAVDQTRTK